MKINYCLIMIAGLVLIGAGCASSTTISTSNNVPDATAIAPSDTKLDLSGKGMESISMSVFDRTGLTELNISNNRLTGALPSQIQRLKNLRVLNASNNQMTGVPAEIGQLLLLEYLDLSNNKLTGLPMELGNLKNLRQLDLRGNNPSHQDLDGIRAKLTNTLILE